MPEIQAFFDRVVKVNLQSPVAALRQEAIKGLALAAIMRRVFLNVGNENQEIANQFSSLLLCMVLEEDEDMEVQCCAIEGLTDITIVYGDMKQSPDQDSEMGVSLQEILESLNAYVFHSNERLQWIACEAICKLFLFDKTRSILSLSNLILLYEVI